MVIMISVYQFFLSNPSKSNLLNDQPGFKSYFLKGLYILAALAISGGLIFGALKMMGVFEQDATKPESWGHVLFNLIILSAIIHNLPFIIYNYSLVLSLAIRSSL